MFIGTPVGATIQYQTFQGPRSSSQSTTVTFAAAPPTNAVALLAYAAGAKTAMSWGRVTPGAKTVVLYATGRCVVAVTGVGPMASDKVTLVWLDKFGHLSPPSSEITVK